MKPLRSFRYSGNKSRYMKSYRRPPDGTKRVVEPYLGSGAYVLSTDLPGLGYELNEDVVEMWRWLQRTTPEELRDLAAMVDVAKVDRADTRSLGLERGAQTYVRVNVAGLVLGQLSAWMLYPQNSLPVESTIAALPRIRQVEVRHGRGEDHVIEPGDLLFVDPPYIGTRPNYGPSKGLDTFDVEKSHQLIVSPGAPKIVTYGDGAQTIMPDLTWEMVATRRVPNVRKGGTVERTEWVAYVDWPGL